MFLRVVRLSQHYINATTSCFVLFSQINISESCICSIKDLIYVVVNLILSYISRRSSLLKIPQCFFLLFLLLSLLQFLFFLLWFVSSWLSTISLTSWSLVWCLLLIRFAVLDISLLSLMICVWLLTINWCISLCNIPFVSYFESLCSILRTLLLFLSVLNFLLFVKSLRSEITQSVFKVSHFRHASLICRRQLLLCQEFVVFIVSHLNFSIIHQGYCQPIVRKFPICFFKK